MYYQKDATATANPIAGKTRICSKQFISNIILPALHLVAIFLDVALEVVFEGFLRGMRWLLLTNDNFFFALVDSGRRKKYR
jgi:hypothetical protein